jgi:hypothetical protein
MKKSFSAGQFYLSMLPIDELRLRTLTPFIISLGGMLAASWPDPRNEQTIHRQAVTVKSSCDILVQYGLGLENG